MPDDTRDRIVDFIRDYTAEHRYPPSMAEIGAGVGLQSKSTVSHHMGRLEIEGRIRRHPFRSRSVVVVEGVDRGVVQGR